jgi:hypothetical protein
MKMIKPIALLMAVLSLTLTAACQDHHFVSYDKMGPLPEPAPSKQGKVAVPTPQPATPYSSPSQAMMGAAPKVEPASPDKSQSQAMTGAAPKVEPGFTGLIASGVVDLSPEAVGSAPPGWTLYIIIRPAEGGSAIAAKRVDKPSFPVSFELTERDIMMGQPKSGMKISVEARYDEDGDPITKGNNDLYGKADGEIIVGAKNALALLKKK